MNLGPPDYDSWLESETRSGEERQPYSQEEFESMLFIRQWLRRRVHNLPQCVIDEAHTFLQALDEEIDNANS